MPASVAHGCLVEAFRPLEATAAEFRRECSALDLLTESLYAEVEQLRLELDHQADELEEGRRRLADRGKQLAEQRKETGRLAQVLEQQDGRLGEALAQLHALREQLDLERTEARQREQERLGGLEQRLREAESERDGLRDQLQAAQAAAGAGNAGDALAPLVAELSELRRQLCDTQSQLMDTRSQLTAALERSAAVQASLPHPGGDASSPALDGQARFNELERERIELESELELVRTRATELQETVNSQRHEMAEQRAELASELRLLRELVEQSSARFSDGPPRSSEPVLALAGGQDAEESSGAPADPVISSVMAQFARLQKDVAQRRKKK